MDLGTLNVLDEVAAEDEIEACLRGKVLNRLPDE